MSSTQPTSLIPHNDRSSPGS